MKKADFMDTVKEKINISEKYIRFLKENLPELEKNSGDLINIYRKKYVEKINEFVIPTRKNENYKYTDLNPVFDSDFKYNFNPSGISVNLDEVFRCDVPELEATNYLTINGWFANKETPIFDLGNGAFLGSLNEVSKKYPDIFKKYFDKAKKDNNDALSLLNSAFASDGIVLYIPENVVIEKPIQIINLLISEQDTFAQSRNLFVIEKNSQAKVIVCDHTLSGQKFLSNSLTEIHVGENAVLDVYNLQNEHNGSSQLSNTFVNQFRGSRFLSNVITLHGGLVRNNLYVDLMEEHCECNLYGLYLTDKWQHVDNYTHIRHLKPNCTSNQLYKGILDDSATGAFNGRILVDKDAQETKAYQANNNILLTNDAKINTKPQLEIYADNVKCSHGATVGQLDDNAMFYLRSRGIPQKEARMLLMYGFAHSIIKEIKVEALKDRINGLVDKRLRGELARCNSCVINCC